MNFGKVSKVIIFVSQKEFYFAQATAFETLFLLLNKTRIHSIKIVSVPEGSMEELFDNDQFCVKFEDKENQTSITMNTSGAISFLREYRSTLEREYQEAVDRVRNEGGPCKETTKEEEQKDTNCKEEDVNESN